MSPTTVALLAFVIVLLAIPIILYRLRVVLDPKRPKPQRCSRQNAREPTHLMIVLGSGGHTAEMIAMLDRAVKEQKPGAALIWDDYTHRTWVASSGDPISAERARQFETMAASLCKGEAGTYDIQIVPRAREIHQPLYTAPVSSLRCLLVCVGVLTQHGATHSDTSDRKDFPDVILCNGPATATILIFTSVLLRFFNVRGCNSKGKMRTIYVESFARVKRLSLSGTLLSRVVDRLLVQWPQLESSSPRAEYIGILV